MRLLEAEAIKAMFDKGYLVIAGGGGGIPVGLNRHNLFYGTEAVVDKDLTSAIIANEIGAETLIIMTGVEYAYVDFGGPNQRALTTITSEEIRRHMDHGEFADGSMKPKIEACLNFLTNGGREAIITSIPNCLAALRGKTGTHIIPR